MLGSESASDYPIQASKHKSEGCVVQLSPRKGSGRRGRKLTESPDGTEEHEGYFRGRTVDVAVSVVVDGCGVYEIAGHS